MPGSRSARERGAARRSHRALRQRPPAVASAAGSVLHLGSSSSSPCQRRPPPPRLRPPPPRDIPPPLGRDIPPELRVLDPPRLLLERALDPSKPPLLPNEPLRSEEHTSELQSQS